MTTAEEEVVQLKRLIEQFVDGMYSYIHWSSPTQVEQIVTDATTPLLAEISRLERRIADIKAHAAPIGNINDAGTPVQFLVDAGAFHKALGEISEDEDSCPAETEVIAIRAKLEGYQAITAACRMWREAFKVINSPTYLADLRTAATVLASVIDAHPE